MTPTELYSRKPERIDSDIHILVGSCYNFIPEISENDFQNRGDIKENTKIDILIYKDFDFDDRRFWRLASIKFNDEFVMIVQNAGREGDDYTGRFITNKTAYLGMIKYIQTLLPDLEKDDDEEDVVSVDDNIPSLVDFYGNQLDNFFEQY